MYRSLKDKGEQIRKELEERKNKGIKGRPKRIGGLPDVATKRQHYEQQLKEQKFICAICERKLNDDRRKYHYDHCHLTNRLRGVLCVACNLLLGQADDNIRILERAIKYLNKHREFRDVKDDISNESVGKPNVHESWLKPIESKPFDKFNWWQYIPEIMQFDVDML